MRTSTGRVQCWGDNAFGQTGDPIDGGVRDLFTVIDSGTAPSHNVIAVDERDAIHSCALLASGGAKCWGSNADVSSATVRERPVGAGELGVREGDADDESEQHSGDRRGWTPHVRAARGRHGAVLGCERQRPGHGSIEQDVLTLATVDSGVAIAAGEHHTCVTRTYGNVRCWGWNASGQLGPSIGGTSMKPWQWRQLASLSAITIRARSRRTARSRAGARCRGSARDQSVTDSTTPVLVKQVLTIPCMGGTCDITRVLDKMIAIDAGAGHTCAIRADGQPFCWGADSSGQLGDGAPLSNKSTARPVSNFSGS